MLILFFSFLFFILFLLNFINISIILYLINKFITSTDFLVNSKKKKKKYIYFNQKKVDSDLFFFELREITVIYLFKF